MNDNNIISFYIVKILPYLPVTILFILGALLYLRAIIFNKGVLLMYIISLIIIDIIIKITISTLMLEDTTTFLLFKINHDVPIYLKIHYVHNIIINYITMNPELMINRESLNMFQKFIETEITIEKISMLNAKELHEYISKIVWDYTGVTTTNKYATIFTWVTTSATIIYILSKWIT
jgi:hypothetical protein